MGFVKAFCLKLPTIGADLDHVVNTIVRFSLIIYIAAQCTCTILLSKVCTESFGGWGIEQLWQDGSETPTLSSFPGSAKYEQQRQRHGTSAKPLPKQRYESR